MLSLLARPAFYYYKTEANKTSEQTLIDVQKNAEAQGVPYSYVLLDSWWYYKGPGAGVTLWVLPLLSLARQHEADLNSAQSYIAEDADGRRFGNVPVAYPARRRLRRRLQGL